MSAGDLHARAVAFRQGVAALNAEMDRVLALVATDPSAARPALDALLTTCATLEAEELALIAALGPASLVGPAECRANWLARRLGLYDWCFATAVLLVRPADTAAIARAARGALAGWPDHPYLATVEEHEAEVADDLLVRDGLFDAAFARRSGAGDALGGSRNRLRAATLAGGDGRITRLRDCAGQAIALADAAGLRREAVAFRIQLFVLLLIWDHAGITRDAVRAAVDWTARLLGTLTELLESSYADGLAGLAGPEASNVAAAFGLLAEANALRDGLPDARAAAEASLRSQRDAQRLDLLLLAAQFKSALGDDLTTAEDILPAAEALARTAEQKCKLHAAWADAWQALGDLPAAIRSAERAALEAAGSASSGLRAQAAERLAALRAETDASGPAEGLDPDDHVNWRIGAAVAAMQAGRPGHALAILDVLRPQAPSTRARLSTLAGMARFELGRYDQAASDFAAAAVLSDHALAVDPDGEGDMAGQREAALLLQTVALTRLGQPVAAWECAERARAVQLRHALGTPPETWEATRATLAARRASMLSITALRWGTLVLSAAPGEAEPQAVLLDAFHAADMNRLLGADLDLADDSDAWTGIIMGAAAGMSALLMPALGERLRMLAAADMLYIIPDSLLYHAPFAALDVAPGTCLAALVPFSLLPYASLLTACPAATLPARAALALAAGEDTQGYDFAGHLDLLADALGKLHGVAYAGARATSAMLQATAAACDVVHVACHGMIDPRVAELSRASSLKLADGLLSAAELGGWRLGGGLAAPGLTFLNACQSGRFRGVTRGEPGGFPAALLRAGRRTLIAPLTHVAPLAAGALAASFYAFLLSGQSIGRALQSARLALRDAGAPVADWASHTMFGVDG